MNGFFAYLYSVIFYLPFILFIIVPALFLVIIFISFFVSNIKDGKRYHWKLKRHIVGTSVFGSLLGIVATFVIVGAVVYFVNVPYPGPVSDPNAPKSTAMLFENIKNIIIFY